MGRQFSHERKHCPVQGCMEHVWPAGMTRRDLEGPRELAMYGAARPKSVRRSSSGTDAVAMEIVVSEMNSMVQLLANTLDEERTRSRLDGRQVIADGKRRRRELISKAARGGLNAL